ncbi:MaoC family dehydratase N-terminal domain-containing protein [Chloroflexota bacterium]
MSKSSKFEYSQLQSGDEFPVVSYKVDPLIVANYLKAVEETSDLYYNRGQVPPTAIAAYAMKTLSESFAVPPGTVHISQQLEFMGALKMGETIICQAKVSRKQERGGFRFLTVDLSVFDQNRKRVMVGRTSFVLPEPKV